MKELIKDILTYLKDNEEARIKLNNVLSIGINGMYIGHVRWDEIEEYDLEGFYSEDEISIFLIHALSSPNGKPICSFFGGYIVEGDESEDNEEQRIWHGEFNHAKTLRTIYLDSLNEGKSHDEAYKLINDKYNELWK